MNHIRLQREITLIERTSASTFMVDVGSRRLQCCIHLAAVTMMNVRERFIGFLVTLVTLGWVGHLTAAGGGRGALWGVGGW